MNERRAPSLIIVVDLESDFPRIVPNCLSLDDEIRLAWSLERLLGRESIDEAVRRWIDPLLDREAA